MGTAEFLITSHPAEATRDIDMIEEIKTMF